MKTLVFLRRPDVPGFCPSIGAVATCGAAGGEWLHGFTAVRCVCHPERPERKCGCSTRAHGSCGGGLGPRLGFTSVMLSDIAVRVAAASCDSFSPSGLGDQSIEGVKTNDRARSRNKTRGENGRNAEQNTVCREPKEIQIEHSGGWTFDHNFQRSGRPALTTICTNKMR